MIKLKYPLKLASSSPRRIQILQMLDFTFQSTKPKYDEDSAVPPQELSKTLYPRFLAEGKALSVSQFVPNELVLGFDTGVFFKEIMLGKPKDQYEAYSTLKRLNGQSHTVFTGVALAHGGKLIKSGIQSTIVHFQQHSEALLEQYSQTDEPLDKAGSYGIQGKGAFLVKSIEGCFYNVMGLPIQLTLNFLDPYKDKYGREGRR